MTDKQNHVDKGSLERKERENDHDNSNILNKYRLSKIDMANKIK